MPVKHGIRNPVAWCAPQMILGAVAVVMSASCRDSGSDADKTTASEPDPVALQIGAREVRVSELQAEIDFLRQRRNPAAADLESFLEPTVERLVALERAKELGLDEAPDLRRQWENMLIGGLRETEIESQITQVSVTDEEIREYFEQNRETYTTPAQVHLALLHLRVPRHADDSTRNAIRQRLDEAREIALELPADTRGFGSHAMAYSEEATSRFKGGDIGWLQAGGSAYRWPDEVVEAGFSLKANGDLSEVIEAGDGFYLIKKLDSREPVVRSLEGRMRSTLEGALLNQKRASLRTQVRQEWQDAAAIIVHEEALGGLHFEPAETPADAPSIPSEY